MPQSSHHRFGNDPLSKAHPSGVLGEISGPLFVVEIKERKPVPRFNLRGARRLNVNPAPAGDCLIIRPCHELRKPRMVFNQKGVRGVAWTLNGARSGPRTGLRLGTAAIDAVRINETHHLYPF